LLGTWLSSEVLVYALIPWLKNFSYFSALLKSDQAQYPGDPSAVIDIPSTVTTGDGWQVGVDNLIDSIVV
jgi:hypothetical protein